MSKIAVIGTGYVGLTTGACFAHLGHEVICADIDADKVAQLQRGEIPILEKDLDKLVLEGIGEGRLKFVLGAATAAAECEFAYLSVPTPQSADGSADLSYIEAAAREIGPVLPPDAIVVNKSTVPVGSTRVVERALGRSDVHVVSNPEFLREGSAVQDFLHPDRVVIGADDQSTAVRVAGLYVGVPAPLMVTDPASAETIKYASNAFLATKLSFVNAVAAVCEGVGADVNDVVLGMGYDKRISSDFLRPGPGWGGSCFPKDSRALIRIAEDAGYDFDLLKGVIRVNDEQFERTAAKVVRMAGGSVDGVRIAVWGITFKAGTDDRRDSPSLEVINRLLPQGAAIRAYDPAVSTDVAATADDLQGIEVVDDPYAAVEGAEVLVVLTEWDEFKWLDLDKVKDSMASARVIDARNLLDRSALVRRGFTFEGIGRA
jgi:UDPglucose 6-dehydrogenase